MRNTLPKHLLLLAGLLLSLQLSAQVERQLELIQELLDRGRYTAALKVSRHAYATAEQQEDELLMAQAQTMQAWAIAGPAPEQLSRRQKRKVRKMLREAQEQFERLGADSLLARSHRLELALQGKDISAPRPGGMAQQRPKVGDLAQEAVRQFRTMGDTLNALKKEKERYEEEVYALNLEQAKQELLLARQQQALDSISLARLGDSLTVARQEQELQAKQAELELQKTQRDRSRIIAAAIIIIAAILFLLYFNSRRKNKVIQNERQRSEELLLNILPGTVADELKAKGSAAARHYEEVTVLFSDFKDFSRISKDLSPQELVEALDRCFRAFDEIAERHGLEKIKTIGDAYMCAAGLPEPSEDQAERAVTAALEMQAWLSQAEGLPFEGARIGLHTGPVVAGVVGARKFAYDIWGDTVNLASRLESKGEIGRVNISQATYERINGQFRCTPRGKVPAKGVGEVEMYFVEMAEPQTVEA